MSEGEEVRTVRVSVTGQELSAAYQRGLQQKGNSPAVFESGVNEDQDGPSSDGPGIGHLTLA